ncbi:MAG TPA: DedA family protein [Thermodesulfovibrionales bacterium]|jgi:membrane protein DedA with SNARE-associated domain|nr:DedA family protein [Thermodesulfovibrionales bacterium]
MLSPATLEHLIRTYGYAALLIGTFFEGETILIIGGLAAHMGYLRLPLVMAIALIGSFSGDQVFYFVGRARGRDLLARHPRWHCRAEKIHLIVARYHDLIMLGFRFVYGIRILTPIVIGSNQRIKASRFIILNAVGAALWAVLVSAGGYLFGTTLEIVMKDIRRYEMEVIIGILLIGGILWMVHYLREKRKAKCT